MAVKKEKFSHIDASTFHAVKYAKTKRRKRSPDAKAIYCMIVELGINLYEDGYFHPKMTPKSLPPSHMKTIVHNIGRLVADEITEEQKKYKAKATKTTKTTKTKKTKKVLPKKK